MAAFANGRFFGGGMKIAPDADVSSGRLEVVTVDGFGLVDFAIKGGKLRKGTHLEEPGIESRGAARAEVLPMRPADGRKIWVEADGEVVGCLPASFESLPGAAWLIV